MGFERERRVLPHRHWQGRPDAELLAAARDGDRVAKEVVVDRHGKLVFAIARGFHSPRASEDLDDLVQVGMVGLLEAVERFDRSRGAFVPFARATVSGHIKRHFRDRSWLVRVPRPLHDVAPIVKASADRLEGRLGRVPTESELAEEASLGADQVREVLAAQTNARPRSLNEPGGEGATELADLVGAPDPGLERAEARATISGLTAGLGRTEREVLVRTFGLQQPQRRIAERIGGSQMQVSRRIRRILEGLGERALAEGRRP